MYTQCPKCETVFRLAAQALRAADGQVRCGRCGEVFSALERLAEDASSFSKGESPYEMESRAEGILQSEGHESAGAQAPETVGDTASSPDMEFAHLQFVNPPDDDLAEEASLEFTLPPGELDRIFIETRPDLLHRLSAVGPRDQQSQTEPAPPVNPPATTDAPSLALSGGAEAPTIGIEDESAAARPPPGTRASGLEFAIDMDSYSHAPSNPNASRITVRSVAWLAGAFALGLLLLFQIVRGHGDWWAAHARLPGTGAPNAGLASYQLRQWGVTGDPAAKGTLRVRASIMNTAAQPQPYPLLRVSLVNRFGAHVGAREFEPAEYLGKAPGPMLAPGQRVDATLDILDPGKDAEGFEIDVCLRGAGGQMGCASDAAGPTQ